MIEVEARVTVKEWDQVRFGDLFATATGAPESIDRVAIPGAQDKVSARMINVPVAKAHERFLLKWDPPEFPHLVANEAFFLEAARRSGLEAADARIVHDSEGVPGLLVRRFDRVSSRDGQVGLLAQEDACQALGRYPADKYRVTTEAVIGGLARVCRARPVAAHALLKQFAFAYLTCNGDAHAKNFSVFRVGAEWRPTPIYDAPTSHVYRDHSMALPLNGKIEEDIGRRDFIALGEAVGVRAPAVERALDELCETVDRWSRRSVQPALRRGCASQTAPSDRVP